VQTYVKQLRNLLKEKQEEIGERNREIEEGVFQAANDPRRPTVAPRMESVPPFLNFAPLDNAVTELAKSAEAYKQAYEQASAKADFGKSSAAELNRMLGKNEQQLTREEGLPGRPWFKHEIYAPGQYTGYEAKTLPAVREALESKRWKQAEEAIVVVSKVLQGEAEYISAAAAKLSALH
jgi:N-acetylated-alpha-linked acidic dipeptidase